MEDTELEPESEEIYEKWSLTEDEKNQWELSYNTSRKLPSMKVPCNQCGDGITMFSSNLHNRTERFGGIRNLLDNFICIRCIRKNNGLVQPSEKVILPRKGKKKDRVEEIKGWVIPISKPKELQAYTIVDLANNPELCAKMTKGNCWKAAMYLDNGKRCVGTAGNCTIFEHCACTIKRK